MNARGSTISRPSAGGDGGAGEPHEPVPEFGEREPFDLFVRVVGDHYLGGGAGAARHASGE